ncbi:MAG: hypothetical protein Phyf2KO_04640 [Phycisphaerales bacterium]
MCPECGYHLTDDDISFATNRAVFLKFTKWSAIKRHTLSVILMLLVVPYVGVFLALPPILSVLCLPSLSMKGVEGKIRRRIWLMSSAWLHVPWIVGGLASPVYEWARWRLIYRTSLDSMLPDYLYDFPDLFLINASAALFALGAWFWRRSLYKLTSIAGMQTTDSITKLRSSYARVALISYAVPLIGLVLWGLVWFLDTFHPGWGT